ncbi:MAG: ABC transporter ATP-binding protein [Haloferacaceae archaeon]
MGDADGRPGGHRADDESPTAGAATDADADRPLLDVRGLEKHYPVTEGVLKRRVGTVRAVDGVSFRVAPGETLGLVGESGCGKSTVATTLLRLEEPTGGRVLFDGEDVTGFDGEGLTRFRREAQLIFQDPTSSFDPRMSVGESVTEPLRIHGLTDRRKRREVGTDLLERVGLDAGDYDRYPHEFSGGQRQRIAIARALVVNPRLIVADEPVSALDVSVRSSVLRLLERLQAEFGIAMVFISHDLSVVRELCDRVAVMYLGEIVETAPTERLFERPRHPYTEALISAIPRPDPDDPGRTIRLSGSVPSASDPPAGCRFHTRCPKVVPPPDLDLDRGVWRRVLDARLRVARGDVDVETVRELSAADRGRVPADLDRTEVAAALREEFDLPARLGDPTAERTVSEALAALAAGDREAAAATLDDAFVTPCETHDPALRPVGDDPDHEVACLLAHPPEDVSVDAEAAAGESATEWTADARTDPTADADDRPGRPPDG